MNQNKKQCVVVIPLYKKEPGELEKVSFRHTMKVSRYDVVIICPENFDFSVYKQLAEGQEFEVKYFSDDYFTSQKSYSDLCVSECFYKAFSEYEYMLMCQLDAYLFDDDFSYYFDNKIDFVGPPVYKGYGKATNPDYLGFFNGGFCLRNIAQCQKACKEIKKFKNVWKLYRKRIFGKRDVLRNIAWKFKRPFTKRTPLCSEDRFFCNFVPGYMNDFRIATYEEAFGFGFEGVPAYMLEKRGGKLPNGCHAFNRYELWEFWKNYISLEE